MTLNDNDKIIFYSDKGEHEFTFTSLARWHCLFEALDVIGNQSDELGIDFDDLELNSIAIKDYIEERFPAMLHDVKIDYATLCSN